MAILSSIDPKVYTPFMQELEELANKYQVEIIYTLTSDYKIRLVEMRDIYGRSNTTGEPKSS